MDRRTPPDSGRAPHPFAFTILYLPFGMASGYVTVTLAYLLSHNGVSVEQVASLVALSLLPQTWKVLWAPLVDTTLSARTWYALSTVVTALAILGMTFIPDTQASMWLIDTLVLVSGITSSFSAMASELLMAHNTTAADKGRAGGWSQAGNLGGGGLGGGVALWMSQHSQPWTGGALLGILSLLCCLALRYYADSQRVRTTGALYLKALGGVGRDVWSIVCSRPGLLTVILLALPIGTGAASGLWSAVPDDWHVSADAVAIVNGLLGGLMSMVGSIAAGYVCDVMHRRTGYLLFGIVQALIVVAMALSARTPFAFVVYTCAYAVLNGAVFGAFSAVALEAIGQRSAATNYNLLACLSNVPIAYMTIVDGHAHQHWGSTGMLYTEAVLCAGGVLVFLCAALALRPRPAALAVSAA